MDDLVLLSGEEAARGEVVQHPAVGLLLWPIIDVPVECPLYEELLKSVVDADTIADELEYSDQQIARLPNDALVD